MTTISAFHAAVQSSTVLEAALHYADAGMSVLPCEGKKASVIWTSFQHRPAHPLTIQIWHRVGLLQNVALICGAVSGNLVVVDCDGQEAMRAFENRFPHLANYTYGVFTGSGKGGHWYFYVRDLPPTTRVVNAAVGNIELRANGCYVVAPPSIHPETGRRYHPFSSLPILRVDNLTEVVEWVKNHIREKHNGHMPPATNSSVVKSANAWAQAALVGECANVRLALPGARNNTLYRAALKMGSLIRDGKLERYKVEDALMEAAQLLTETDGMAATLRTILSGIETGMENSRDEYTKRA